MRFQKDLDDGTVTATCEKCGKVYDMTSEWDKANLDWHGCSK